MESSTKQLAWPPFSILRESVMTHLGL